MKAFILFILASFIIYPVNATAQETGNIIIESLFNPSDFKIVDENRLLITDNTINNPVYLVDIKSDKILQKVKEGTGPGELSSMYKNISITDSLIYMWDYGRQMLHYYDYDLNFEGTHLFRDLGYIYNVVISEDKVLVIGNGDDFTTIYNFDSDDILGTVVQQVHIKDHSDFEQFNHIPLRQAFKITADEDGFFVSNEFTSLVFHINEDGIDFTNSTPSKIIQEVKEGVYISTDLLYNELCSLDIEADTNNIIVLFKGEKADKTVITKEYKNRINEYLEDFVNADQLLFYDKSGNFIRDRKLGRAVKKIEVYDDKLYYLTTYGGKPKISSNLLSGFL